MIDDRIKLNVLWDDNGSFTDQADKAVDFLRDQFTMDLVTAEDYLYVGFYKAVSAVYCELATANTNSSTITVEAFDGTSWSAIEHRDETLGFARSGFITWDRADMAAVNSSNVPQGETTVNGQTGYWVRISVDTTTTSMVFDGINLVFSDDAMLLTEFRQVLDPRILDGDTSHIRAHVSARNAIVQQLRNDGYIKYNNTSGKENFTQWDLLDTYEIREAATFKALSYIYFNLSDEIGDQWWSKHSDYKKRAERTLNGMSKLSVDTDDDGVESGDEKLFQKKSQSFSR